LGKTTLIRKLMAIWTPNFDVHYLHLGSLRGAGFFRSILAELGERPRMGKDRMFDQVFSQLSKRQRPLCLLLDEAQLMDIPSMTDLRLLCGNLELSGKLKLLLCGQPILRKTLQADSLTDLRERISLQCSLKSMGQLESVNYLEHRLKAVGGELNTFEENAIQLIVNYGEGVPRKINGLAFKAMVNAVQKKLQVVDATCVREACAAEVS
jgi:general secretion pathway protein A